jgi:hypothetical protein
MVRSGGSTLVYKYEAETTNIEVNFLRALKCKYLIKDA